jgi:NDP-sugar pyrophosphorylase family protein
MMGVDHDLALGRVGVREVMINTHHRPGSIRAAVGDGARFGMRVRYSHERRLLGSIGGVRRVRGFFGDAPFLLVNGDMVFDLDIRRLIARHRESGAVATVSLQRFPKRGRYGAVVTDARGRILSFGGHPEPARGRAWHFTGIQVVEPRLIDRLPPGRAETARDLYGPLIREGAHLLGVPLRGQWYDLSSPPLYLASQMELLRQGFADARRRLCVATDVRLGRGARVRRSVVGPGCEIEAGAVVEDSVLWRKVRVGPGAVVRRSIVTDGVRIPPGARLVGAVRLRA